MTTGIERERTRDHVTCLDGWLAARARPDHALGCTIRAADHDAAAAVAGRHGYTLATSPVDEPGALWAEFRPAT